MGSLFKPKQVGPTQGDVLAASKPINLITPTGQVTFDNGVGTAELSPQMQQWVDTLMGRAEAQEEALEAYDPGQTAEEYYSKFVAPGLRKMQERDYLGSEARLLAQGGLGATRGRRFLSDLLANQEDIRLGARGQAFQQAQQYHDLMRGRQLGDIQLGREIMGSPSSMFGTAIEAGLGKGQILSQYKPQYQESTGMKLLKMGAGIAGTLATGGAFGAGGLFGGAAGAAGAGGAFGAGGLGTGISSYGGTLASTAPIGLGFGR